MFKGNRKLFIGVLVVIAVLFAFNVHSIQTCSNTSRVILKGETQPQDTTLKIEDITAKVPYGHRVANRTADDVDIIVIHSNYHEPSFKNGVNSADTFSTKGCIAQFKYYDVAPHYMVCRDASILRMVKEKDVALASGKKQSSRNQPHHAEPHVHRHRSGKHEDERSYQGSICSPFGTCQRYLLPL